jgi:glycosyltransferase involved in cell wall biosynthesis
MVRFSKPGDERELADGILELYRDPDQRARQVAEAARFNASFNWEQQKKGYFEVVDSLLATARR